MVFVGHLEGTDKFVQYLPAKRYIAPLETLPFFHKAAKSHIDGTSLSTTRKNSSGIMRSAATPEKKTLRTLFKLVQPNVHRNKKGTMNKEPDRLAASPLSPLSHLEVRQEQRRLVSLGFAVLHRGSSQRVVELYRLVRSDPHFILPHHKRKDNRHTKPRKDRSGNVNIRTTKSVWDACIYVDVGGTNAPTRVAAARLAHKQKLFFPAIYKTNNY